MISTLVSEQRFDFQTDKSCTFISNARIGSLVRPGQISIPNANKKLEKFRRALECGFEKSEWAITADFNLNDAESQGQSTWDVDLKGDILSAMHQLMYHGDKDFKLRLELTMNEYHSDPYDYGYGIVRTFTMKEFLPDEDSDDPHGRYVQRQVSLPATQPGYYWNVSVGVDLSDFICVADYLPRVSYKTAKNIFAERMFCDLEVICDDGTVIPCHKAFLAAQSTVLSANLQRDFKEKKENQLKISDMSAEGVKAFLEFIYCGHVHAALKSSELALELLIAADKYDVPVLWSAVVAILMEKDIPWFDIDVALRLFNFTSKCVKPEGSQLKRKMIQVFAQKPNELSQSALYKEMFGNEVTREMFIMTLEKYKP